MDISIESIFKLCSDHLIDKSLLPPQNENDLTAMVKLHTVPPNRWLSFISLLRDKELHTKQMH